MPGDNLLLYADDVGGDKLLFGDDYSSDKIIYGDPITTARVSDSRWEKETLISTTPPVDLEADWDVAYADLTDSVVPIALPWTARGAVRAETETYAQYYSPTNTDFSLCELSCDVWDTSAINGLTAYRIRLYTLEVWAKDCNIVLHAEAGNTPTDTWTWCTTGDATATASIYGGAAAYIDYDFSVPIVLDDYLHVVFNFASPWTYSDANTYDATSGKYGFGGTFSSIHTDEKIYTLVPE